MYLNEEEVTGMDQLFGILIVLVMGAIISIPIHYWYYVVTTRKEKKKMAAYKITYEIEQAKKEEREKLERERKGQQVKEEKEKQLEHLLTYGFPIIGGSRFKEAVRRVLQELKEKAPHRYAEAVTLLPKAEYVAFNEQDHRFSGRSDGLFTMDGSNYESFRWVFLHEVGHNVAYKANKDYSEEAANNYANQVIAELTR